MNQPIYIIDGARTPFLKARNAPGPFAASDMATAAGSALLARQRFAPDQLDEVIARLSGLPVAAPCTKLRSTLIVEKRRLRI